MRNFSSLQQLTHDDLPVGLAFGISVKPRCEKYFALSEAKAVLMMVPFRAGRGTYRDRHEAWCGMRWTSGCSTRLSRVDEGILADGEIARSRSPDAGIKSW
jgi:hypothetical protein